jgi:acetyl esterase/lipase
MDLTFENLPPTFIAAGSKDQLAPSSALWANQLQARSHDVNYEVYEGEGHGFFNTDGPATRQLGSDILTFLARN